MIENDKNQKDKINEELIKSFEISYIFEDKPINRLKTKPTLEKKSDRLDQLKESIKKIQDCELKSNAKNLVFNDGNINSPIMIVGEGPGQKEDEMGKPFMGDAGQLLNKMLKAIKKRTNEININLKVLGVTILTSLDNKSLKKIGHTKSVEQLVLKQANLIKKSGCDGIVCSAQEAKMVRKKYKNLFIITPGIRLPGDSVNDQSRVMTPKDAFKNKVSGIVMGRSLIEGNIKNNIQRLIDHLNQ